MKIKLLVCFLYLGIVNVGFAEKQMESPQIFTQLPEVEFLAQSPEQQTVMGLHADEQQLAEATRESNIVHPQLMPTQITVQTHGQNTQPRTEVVKVAEHYVINNNQSIKSSQVCLALQQGFNTSYNGACHQGLPNGYGVAKGNLGTYKGGFVNGLFEGQGTLDTYIIANAYEGNFKAGKKDGQGYIYDRFSRENRLAKFENDKFIMWLDNAETSSISEYTANHTTIVDNIPANNSSVQVGQQTAYGKIIGIDGQIVTVEKISYDKEGYQRPEIRKYPISLFNR